MYYKLMQCIFLPAYVFSRADKDFVQCLIYDECFFSGKWTNEDFALRENVKLLRFLAEPPQESSTNEGSENPDLLLAETSADVEGENQLTEMERAKENMLLMHQ